MSLAPSALLSLQRAGESLYAARQAFAQEVQINASHVVGIVASEPFSSEADRAYARLRSIARMAHDLQSMEEQLKTLYASALDLGSPEVPVLVALSNPRQRPPASTNPGDIAGAEDAEVKPLSQKKPLKAKAAKNAASEPSTPIPRMSGNDAAVLAYLKQVLDRRSWKTFTQAAIAEGAGIPRGSVGLAMRRVMAAGIVREGQKGSYRLV